MNILLVADPDVSLRTPKPDSVGACVVKLANELVADGHVVSVVAGDNDERDNYRLITLPPSIFTLSDATCSEVVGQRNFQAFQFGLLDASPYDIIHYHTSNPELLEVGALHKKPSFVTIYEQPNEKNTVMYGFFIARTTATVLVADDELLHSWQPTIPNVQHITGDTASLITLYKNAGTP